MRTILLLDGHNLLYRAFTSLPQSIVAGDAQPINGVYGLVGSILRFTRDLGADGAVAAFDAPEVNNFRQERYPPYQAQRGPLGGDHAEEFRRQTLLALAGLPAIGIPALTMPGYEADDILGTLGRLIAESGNRAILISTDRDLLQLVRPGIEVLSPGNPPLHVIDAGGVRARMGVSPEGIVPFKALAGDASDNIPGVAGIGVKTAVTLVNAYGDLEAIYGHLAELPPRARAALELQREEAFLFREIVTIRTDLELPLPVSTIPRLALSENDRVRDLLERMVNGRP